MRQMHNQLGPRASLRSVPAGRTGARRALHSARVVCDGDGGRWGLSAWLAIRFVPLAAAPDTAGVPPWDGTVALGWGRWAVVHGGRVNVAVSLLRGGDWWCADRDGSGGLSGASVAAAWKALRDAKGASGLWWDVWG